VVRGGKKREVGLHGASMPVDDWEGLVWWFLLFVL
jgi:hypothetical protein